VDDRLRRRYTNPELAQTLIEYLAILVPSCDLDNPEDEDKMLRAMHQLLVLTSVHEHYL